MEARSMSTEVSTDRVDRATRRSELAAVTFKPNGQMFQPANGRELMDMANLMSTAGLMVKDIYRNNPGACMGLIAVCAPYGLNPLQVSWKTYMTKADAPIAYEAQVIVAMMNASGAVKGGLRYRYEGEGPSRVCIASGVLRGDSEPVEVRSPPLGQITVKNSPLWKTDPDQQLAYYTGRSWARRYKPEMLLGIYDVDEMEPVAIGPDRARDITPREAPRRGGAIYRDPAPAPAVDEIEEGQAVEIMDAETAASPSAHDRLAEQIRSELAGGRPAADILRLYGEGLEAMRAAAPALAEALAEEIDAASP